MARMNMPVSLRVFATRVAWCGQRRHRQLTRHIGFFPLLLTGAAMFCLTAWLFRAQQIAALGDQRARAAEQQRREFRPQDHGPAMSDDAPLAFHDALVSIDDIPGVVHDLIRLAEVQHVILLRGEYQAHPDIQGGFMRYRMTFPVRGNAQAIQAYLYAALRAHKTLALERAQFKRERIESPDLDAQVHWVLLTRLPATVSHATLVATPDSDGARS